MDVNTAGIWFMPAERFTTAMRSSITNYEADWFEGLAKATTFAHVPPNYRVVEVVDLSGCMY